MVKTKKDTAIVKSFFDNPANYLHNNVVIDIRKKVLEKELGKISGKKIIDLGCGNGDLSIGFLKHTNTVTFVDISDGMLANVKSKILPEWEPNSHIIQSTLEELKMEEPFDIILCLGVLSHVPDVTTTINKISNFMNSGSLLFLQFTNNSNFISRVLSFKNKVLQKDVYDKNKTTLSGVNTVLESLDLKVKKRINYFPVLPLMPLLSYNKRLKLIRFLSNKMPKLGGETILVISKMP